MAAARSEPAGIPAASGRSRVAAATAKGRSASPVPLASSPHTLREISLYAPVKRFLEARGFDVKGEICGCDLVALRGNEPPLVVIGELKLGFNLELVLQGINRAAACDEIWLAVRFSRRAGREQDPRVRKLCRLLGFGLLGVASTGRVEVLVEPGPWRPRRDPKRRSRLINEHRRRQGDPVSGGSTRAPIMTAYRQQALACAAMLADAPRRVRHLKASVPEAPKILRRNVYGWFQRIQRGIYALTADGETALSRWPQPWPLGEGRCDRAAPILSGGERSERNPVTP